MSKAELRKAAVLLRLLPSDVANAALARLDPHEQVLVKAAMADAAILTAEEQEAVIVEFARLDVRGHAPADQLYSAGEFAAWASRPTKRSYPLAREGAHPLRPFAFLADVDGRALALAIADEREQTIAFVASHAPAARGADLLGSLHGERQTAVLRAVAAMRPTDPAVATCVADALAEHLAAR
jgi:flagellar motor switch protein FliG